MRQSLIVRPLSMLANPCFFSLRYYKLFTQYQVYHEFDCFVGLPLWKVYCQRILNGDESFDTYPDLVSRLKNQSWQDSVRAADASQQPSMDVDSIASKEVKPHKAASSSSRDESKKEQPPREAKLQNVDRFQVPVGKRHLAQLQGRVQSKRPTLQPIFSIPKQFIASRNDVDSAFTQLRIQGNSDVKARYIDADVTVYCP